MKNLVLFFFLIVAFQNSFGCLNGETKELKNGVTLFNDYDYGTPNGHDFYNIDFVKIKKQLDSLYRKTNDIAYLSDVGVLLIIEKKYYEAIKLYQEIELKYPNRYSTASNLGTIYELIGNDEKALFWIKQSIKINPKSHYNSEWIHLNILQAKINNELINSKFLIGVNFGNDLKPKTILSKQELSSLRMALFYQLNERITFIKGKDKIIGLLLFELGNMDVLLKNNTAQSIFQLSKEYGYNSQILEKRLNQLKTKRKAYIAKQVNKIDIKEETIFNWLQYLIVLLTFGIVILIVIKFAKKKQL